MGILVFVRLHFDKLALILTLTLILMTMTTTRRIHCDRFHVTMKLKQTLIMKVLKTKIIKVVSYSKNTKNFVVNAHENNAK